MRDLHKCTWWRDSLGQRPLTAFCIVSTDLFRAVWTFVSEKVQNCRSITTWWSATYVLKIKQDLHKCAEPRVLLNEVGGRDRQRYKKHLCRIGVGAGKFFGRWSISAQISPNLPKLFLCDFCLQSFLPRTSRRPFLVWPPKKSLRVFFCKRWAPFLPRFLAIFTRFSAILPDF